MLRISALLLCFGFAALTSCTVREKKKAEEPVADAAPAVNELPSLAITGPDNKTIIAKELKGNIVLILFQPDCDHCQRETTAIRENVEKFAPYQVYFISSATMPELQKFFIDYKLDNLPNFHYATTTLENVLNAIGPISAPSLFVYSDGKKLGHFNGETDIKEIVKVL